MNRLIRMIFVCGGLAGLSSFALAQGIPEPGIVLYGRVLANDGETTVAASAVNVQLSSIQQVVTAEVTRGADGFHYYVAQFPFESVLPGASDDRSVPNLPLSAQTYQLESSTSVQADGATDSDPTVSEAGGSVKTFQFGGSGARGAVFRMDLITTFDGTPVVSPLPPNPQPPIPHPATYDAWAITHFGENSELAGRDGDPDGDGHVNEFEWIAGLDPNSADPNDPMSQFVLEVAPDPQSPGSIRVTFRPKVPGRNYAIRRSPTLGSTQDWRLMPAALQTEAPLQGAPEGVVQGVLQDPLAPLDQGFYEVQIELEP